MKLLYAAAALLAALPCLALAQAFPSRQVTIVVPYQPGGTNDIIERTLTPKTIVADTPEHFASFAAAESQKWRKVVTASGAKAD